ncbi:MAG: EF-P lysine aminoacylase GenX [Hyphomicrobium sp.]|uniref:EF-P lysine aminoacylase EpmA n=1 Tax=Hyphomicrobium sp. TaxID=82 RepID=UPI0013225E85|nr:EF-P lysine aminoacylase EpmA [Hyphomicrobium sp.]KAB2940280.1 MAG: EF-P lysine aminoacylase GenX [Hyphomicrobium sp.]MBZ0211094.1 EF-P lysine aminoacylase GenX [Hyphomicrobium sp.]MCZ7593478.1 EF-P lysine aminoacylase EpmA [Hyphomicrobium sp.]
MSTDRPWWTPATHADRRPLLLTRARIKAAIRAWFEAQGFVEVETGCLQISPGNEAHLHAFRTELVAPDLSRRTLYLHTSPELACKKLLAAGERNVFTFAPVFRNRERGALHAPEFTMLEWYRAEAPYEAMMDDCAALLKLAAETADNRFVSWRGVTSNPRAVPERLTVAAAFARYAGVDLLARIGADANDRDALAAAAESAGITPRDDDTWADIFSKLLTALVEPKLGNGRPTLLTEYPASEAPLARPCTGDPRLAERFELYCCGVELANGFGELTDPELQRRRLEAEMDKKEARYGERYPIDEDFIAALAAMPPASGCALGFDRLVMLATGATRIDQVLWTPMSER